MPLSQIATIGPRFDLLGLNGKITGNLPLFDPAVYTAFTTPWALFAPLHDGGDLRGYTQSLTTRHKVNVIPNEPFFSGVDTIQKIINGGTENFGLVFRHTREDESLQDPIPSGSEAFYLPDSLYVSRASEFFGAIGDDTPRRRFQAMAAAGQSWFCWWPDPGFVLEFRPGAGTLADPFELTTWTRRLRTDLTTQQLGFAGSTAVPRGSFTTNIEVGVYGNDNLQILRLYFPRQSYDPPSIPIQTVWFDEDEANQGTGRLEISDSVFTTLPQRNKSIIVNRESGNSYLGLSVLIEGEVFDVTLVNDEPLPRLRRFQRLTLVSRGD